MAISDEDKLYCVNKRNQYNEQHPDYNINTWDAGWYQLKDLVKESEPELYKAFNKAFDSLSDKMRPLVYELGFLNK